MLIDQHLGKPSPEKIPSVVIGHKYRDSQKNNMQRVRDLDYSVQYGMSPSNPSPLRVQKTLQKKKRWGL